jgi:uracil phosphoribosyltransferase
VRTTIVDHPLAALLLSRLRDEATGRAEFGAAVDGLGGMLVYEATRSLRTESVAVRTPLADTTGARLSAEPFLLPILRAGLGLLGPAQRLLPGSATGFVGVSRDEATFSPVSYLTAVPEDLDGRPVLVLDPMLATGGSLAFALEVLASRRPGPTTAVCILAAPEGIARIEATGLVEEVVVAAVDERLDERAFIVPGLGDAGDRLFGAR